MAVPNSERCEAQIRSLLELGEVEPDAGEEYIDYLMSSGYRRPSPNVIKCGEAIAELYVSSLKMKSPDQDDYTFSEQVIIGYVSKRTEKEQPRQLSWAVKQYYGVGTMTNLASKDGLDILSSGLEKVFNRTVSNRRSRDKNKNRGRAIIKGAVAVPLEIMSDDSRLN